MNVTLLGDNPVARSMGSHQSANAKTHTWLTPPHILHALGHFDLDPCAAPEPRPWPTADRHWTHDDQAIHRQWFGRVWLNPPFGPLRTTLAFMRRMADHNHGVALLFARTETELFFETVWDKSTALLFLKGRPHFCRQNGEAAKANSGAPVCLIAYGQHDAQILRTCGIPGKWVSM